LGDDLLLPRIKADATGEVVVLGDETVLDLFAVFEDRFGVVVGLQGAFIGAAAQYLLSEQDDEDEEKKLDDVPEEQEERVRVGIVAEKLTRAQYHPPGRDRDAGVDRPH
jgi:hypothetical protein